MDNFRLTEELNAMAREISKAKASAIDPKSGTSVSFLQYYTIAGRESILNVKSEAEQKMSANNERYSSKVAQEMNQPIIAERDEAIKTIKESVRTQVNSKINARLEQIKKTELLPMRESRKILIQDIQTLINFGYVPSEREWKLWGEQFAGNAMEEKMFAALAKTNNITILPSFNATKSIERLEAFRQMANIAIDNLDNAEDSITALSFLNVSDTSPLGELIAEIDSDIASIIPAERLTVLQRLKDAKQTAFDKDNVRLSVKIGSFIDKHIDKLATPEEINETLYAEAEKFIEQGMNAVKE